MKSKTKWVVIYSHPCDNVPSNVFWEIFFAVRILMLLGKGYLDVIGLSFRVCLIQSTYYIIDLFLVGNVKNKSLISQQVTKMQFIFEKKCCVSLSVFRDAM